MGLYLGETSLGGSGAGGGGGIDGGVAFPVTVVSGGGGAVGGGTDHGGGGAGGYLTQVCQFHTGKTYDVQVGAGGAVGSQGGVSYIETAVGYLALPGGGEGAVNYPPGAGACDGGSGNTTSTRREAISASQVFAINTPYPQAARPTTTTFLSGINLSAAHESGYCERYGSTGGNGMGGASPRNAYNFNGEGGPGIASNLISTTFATNNSIGEVQNGEVCFCGGGSSSNTNQTRTGGGGQGNGDPNTGGGGQGHGYGGSGGSGVVFVQAKEDTSITTTGTVVTETVDGIKTYCFKTSGTITFN